MEAELTVGYSLFKETYTSQISFEPGKSIVAISHQTNLFDYLHTEWAFAPGRDPNTCWVSFKIEFQFKSAIYSRVSDLFFEDIVENMVAAFEKRCRTIYDKN